MLKSTSQWQHLGKLHFVQFARTDAISDLLKNICPFVPVIDLPSHFYEPQQETTVATISHQSQLDHCTIVVE